MRRIRGELQHRTGRGTALEISRTVIHFVKVRAATVVHEHETACCVVGVVDRASGSGEDEHREQSGEQSETWQRGGRGKAEGGAGWKFHCFG